MLYDLRLIRYGVKREVPYRPRMMYIFERQMHTQVDPTVLSFRG